ncbi:MAG: hypothetical protein ACYS8W_15620 [Planctomycetota bacterium]|jgi:hypothetical protein
MRNIRLIVLGMNTAVLLLAAGLGMYFFGGLGFWMKNAGVPDRYCSRLFFEDMEIPNLNPRDYLPSTAAVTRDRKLEDYWAIWTKIPVVIVDLTNGGEIKLTPGEILEKKIRKVCSVVYSAGAPERSGCYLDTFLTGGGTGMYFYEPGDEFHIEFETGNGKMEAVFRIAEIREIETERKYEVVFENDVGNSVPMKYERATQYVDLGEFINR